MTRRRRPTTIAAVSMTLLLIAALGPGSARAATPSSVPVSFTVSNVNRSGVPCLTDGRKYTVTGRLVTPAGLLPNAVTLYLHGLGFGRFFWDLGSVPGYDFSSTLAGAGHASVIIDRLGYGSSAHPVGYLSCIGGQADIAHQIITQLRTGGYQANGAPGPSFARVGLVGHSAGGLIAQVEAYSFGDIDALGIMSWADGGSSERAIVEFAKTGLSCATGGDAHPAGASGYAFFGKTGADFVGVMFHNADSAVVAATVAQRDPDPCGDTGAVAQSLVLDMVRVPAISVPVLLAYGDSDALFPPPAGVQQRKLYTGTRDVTLITLVNTGHAVTLERSAPVLAADTASWLQGHGL